MSSTSSGPMFLLGAAGAFTIAALLRARYTSDKEDESSEPVSADPPIGPSVSMVHFDFGRPVAADVRAIVASGWASPRGTGASRRLHRGLDIGLPIGTPILAIDGGTVTHVDNRNIGNSGLWIAIRHESGIASRYFHLSRTLVKVGQHVQRGERIALSGDTGSRGVPHLHLDLRAPITMRSSIEATLGRPRSGWGPEMQPFGFSIPGEPLIPVDGHREQVRTDAAAMGITVRDPSLRRNATLTYRSVGESGDPYPQWLQRARGKSGVYVIRERDTNDEPVIAYVGQSSTGRLYETLTRHLQTWRRWKGFWRGQYGAGHDPGLTYDRGSVEVAVKVTASSRALDEEARLIRRLQPRDNVIGQPDVDDVPF